MRHPEMPEPMGVFRCVEHPTYNDAVYQQVESATERSGEGDLEALFETGDTWTV